MAGGRPTDYDPDYHPPKAREFCSEFGFTDVTLAKLFDIAKSTVNKWKKEHPEFSDSIHAGKDEFDSEKVEQSLLKRALGFRYTETTRECVNPAADTKLVITKKVSKYCIPDVPAGSKWLNNRRPSRWRDKQDIELTADLTINLIDSFTEEEEESLDE